MQRREKGLLVGGLLLLIAFAIYPTLAGAMTQDQLNGKALMITDLPTGWSVDNTEHTTIAGCFSPLFRSSNLVLTRAQFDNGGSTPILQEEIAWSKSAPKLYSSTRQRLIGCKSIPQTIQGHPLVATIGQLSFPRVSTRSVAFNVRFTAAGVSGIEDLVLFQSGPYVAAVLLGDVGSVDTSLLQEFTDQALTKIQGSGDGSGSVAASQLNALVELDKPGAPPAEVQCIADWLRNHVSASTLATYLKARTPQQILTTPGLYLSLVNANVACPNS